VGKDWYDHERQEREPRPICRKLPVLDPALWPMYDYYLRARSLDSGLARYNLWYPSHAAGDFWDRIVIPCTSQVPGNLYWQARSMAGQEPRYQSPANSREDSLVVVWPRGSSSQTPRIVVEGPMDALAAAQHGCVGIALMGLTPSAQVFGHLMSLCFHHPVVVVVDRDAQETGISIQLWLAQEGIRARIASPYPYNDLAEMDREARQEILR